MVVLSVVAGVAEEAEEQVEVEPLFGGLDGAVHRRVVGGVSGWVYMPMLGPKVFDRVAEVASHELAVQVFETGLRPDTQLSDTGEPAFFHTRAVDVGGRQWTMAISSIDAFVHASRVTDWGDGHLRPAWAAELAVSAGKRMVLQ